MKPSFAAALLGLLVPSLWAQAPGSGPVPDETLYWAVFHRIEFQENITARLASQGKDTKPSSSYLQTQIGLTDAEWTQLRTIALDYIASEKAFLASRTQVFAAIKGDGPNAPPDPVKQGQLKKLETDNGSAKTDHIKQLKTALGESRFKVLDAWARREVLPRTGQGVGTTTKKGGN